MSGVRHISIITHSGKHPTVAVLDEVLAEYGWMDTAPVKEYVYAQDFVYIHPANIENRELAELLSQFAKSLVIDDGVGPSFAEHWWSGSLTNVVLARLESYHKELPLAVAGLRNLQSLSVVHSWLEIVPGALGRLPQLRQLDLRFNKLSWIPSTLVRPFDKLILEGNPICRRGRIDPEWAVEAHADELRVFRYEFAEAAIGLQDLELPALVTLEILDALCPNAVPMHKKWDLAVAVKHFRR
jgi:Leucine-rich repeat (LRR) protein